jgi:hypothetical protein
MKASYLAPWIVLATAVIFGITACPETIDPPVPLPPAVRIVPNNGDTSVVERGTRAEEGSANYLRVEWELLDISTYPIDEYRVFLAFDTNADDTPDSGFRYIGNVPPEQNYFIDQHRGIDSTFFYLVGAVDSRGRMSDTSIYFLPDSFSTYVHAFKLGYKVGFLNIVDDQYGFDDSVTTKPTFQWCLGRGFPLPNRYVVKVFTPSFQLVYLAQVPHRNFDDPGACLNATLDHLTFHPESYSPNDTLTNDSLKALADVTVHYVNPIYTDGTRLKKGDYVWRVDAIYAPGYESKSRLSSFTVTRDWP